MRRAEKTPLEADVSEPRLHAIVIWQGKIHDISAAFQDCQIRRCEPQSSSLNVYLLKSQAIDEMNAARYNRLTLLILPCLASLFLASNPCMADTVDEPKKITIKRCETPPRIDGVLNDGRISLP